MDGTAAIGGAGVSTREAEVLAALGDHLSNVEIAARLFISVRTVESHVSSLLRKLGAASRRELAEVAGAGRAPSVDAGPAPATLELPRPLTSFVGRRAEREALTATLADHRLVTATGPGGVGKTRLALAVAEAERDAGTPVWFADLVPVTDPDMVAAAVAVAMAVPELQGTTVPDAIVARVGATRGLLVLDNCEHVLEGVAVLVEDLLARCRGLRILATSRARLVLPFEHVSPVPGLSRPADGTEGDAVALFVERASAAGPFEPSADDRRRIAAVAADLDGLALALELAAARVPTLGLDGIVAGLDGRLRLLAGGRRRDDRHSSLRSAIDWSHALLGQADQALLRRVAVFLSPFTVAAAVAVAGRPPVDPALVADGLARLAEHSLLVARPGPTTHYRALETIRQYGEERLEEAGDLDAARAAHLAWSLATARALGADDQLEHDPSRLDAVIDDLRAASRWAAGRPDRRAEAHALAVELGRLTFRRGTPAESQRRYGEAADLAPDVAARADALRLAAGAAFARHHGDDALTLLREAADASVAAGDRAAAARHLANAGMMISRFSGLIAHLPEDHVAGELVDEASHLAVGAPEAEGLVFVARSFLAAEDEAGQRERAREGVRRARELHDVLVESAALDLLTAVELGLGDIPAGQAAVAARVALLEGLRPDPGNAEEVADCWAMASETALAAGDVAGARRHAVRLAELPFLREEGHLAHARRIKVEAVAGDVDLVARLGERFLEGWVRAGRPRVTNLSSSADALVFAHALLGDDEGEARWRAVSGVLARDDESADRCESGSDALFEALVDLHRGRPDDAMGRLGRAPEGLRRWYSGMWRSWYAAAWAEAAVLAGHPDAAARLARARPVVAPNPPAAALVERAAALHAGDVGPLAALADGLDAAGCTYQAARTRVLAGGAAREAGEAVLAGLGTTPMAPVEAGGHRHSQGRRPVGG